MIKRELVDTIFDQCFGGKVILILGARQVGKTTLLKELQKKLNVPTAWLNADEPDISAELNKASTSSELIQFIGPHNKIVIIDEAQQIKNIGRKIKLIYDSNKNIQIIATGSSSFDLLNNANEPLTGRKKTFNLFPISFGEVVQHTSLIEARRLLEARMIFGWYPDVLNNPGKEKEILLELTNSYLYKDILMLDGIRKASVLQKLVQSLAFQTGSEVSYHELARTIGNINSVTVEKYLDLLEKSFVVYKIPGFNRNLRNELKKGKKYYFYDNGIRNAIISNFAPFELRFDKGALWENFLLAERLKTNNYNGKLPNTYFWRTHDQAEIDYIEESDGVLDVYELKWQKKNMRFPVSFLRAYPNNHTSLIHRENYLKFIL